MSEPHENSPVFYSEFCELLREDIGLRLASDEPALARAVQVRMGAQGLSEVEDYRAVLKGAEGPGELSELAGELVIGQSCINDEHLTAICEGYLRPLLRGRIANRPQGSKPSLRVWSVNCGNGAEIYSVLLHVAQMTRLSAWDLKFLGTDLSGQKVARARRGVYSSRQLSRVGQAELNQYFVARRDDDDAEQGCWTVAEELRSPVEFLMHNILAPEAPQDESGYFNLILCRGILGQVTCRCRQALLGKLGRSLSPDGLLILGAGEAAGLEHPLLEAVPEELESLVRRCPGRKGPMPPEESPADWERPTVSVRKRLRQIFLPDQARPTVRRPREPDAAGEGDEAEQLVRRARQLAQDFQFPQALLSCRRAVDLEESNAAAHYLRGVLARRMDRLEEATEALERACSLDEGLAMAHFLLGHIHQEKQEKELAGSHYQAALEALGDCPADQAVPFGEGLSVGLLQDLCRAGLEAVSQIPAGAG